KYWRRRVVMASPSERALEDAAVDPQRRAGRCRRQRARDVGDERGDLVRRGEAFDERGRTHLLEELLLELAEGRALGFGERPDELVDPAGLGRPQKNAVDDNARPSKH